MDLARDSETHQSQRRLQVNWAVIGLNLSVIIVPAASVGGSHDRWGRVGGANLAASVAETSLERLYLPVYT